MASESLWKEFVKWSGLSWLGKLNENPNLRDGTTIKEHHQKMELANRKVANRSIDLGKYVIHYAYLSQQGYNPSRPDWVNQDDCIVIEHFESEPDQLFVGVFDGHGALGTGDHAAQAVSGLLPQALKMVREQHGFRQAKQDAVFEEAFARASEQLIGQLGRKNGDAGATAVVALFSDERLYVANCGDCRCILGQRLPQVSNRARHGHFTIEH
eukprot:9352261-Pyramimonas_sp.AAC.2